MGDLWGDPGGYIDNTQPRYAHLNIDLIWTYINKDAQNNFHFTFSNTSKFIL